MIKVVHTILPIMACLAFSAMAQDSRLGTYHAERLVVGEAQTAREGIQMNLTISNVQGDRLYSITKPIPYDVGPPAVGVFESGSCILLDSFHGIIEFYDRLGTVIRTVRLFKEALPELERVMPFAVHTHSVSLAVSEPRRVGVRVFRFTEEGEMIFQADLAGQFASGVFLSNSGDQCAVGTTQWNDKGFEETTVLLSGDGTVWGSFPVGCIVGAFSENDSLLLVANRREQALVSVAGRRIIDRWAIAAGSLILDVNAQGNAFFVLSALSPSFVQGRWDYAHPSVVRIDSEGMRREVLTEAERHFGTAQLKNVGGELRLEIDGMLQSIR